MNIARPDPSPPATAPKPKLGIVRQRPAEPDRRDELAAAMLTEAGLAAAEMNDPEMLRSMLADMALQAGVAAQERDHWQAVAREAVGVAKDLAGPFSGVAGNASEAAALKARIADLEVERDLLVADLRLVQRQMMGLG